MSKYVSVDTAALEIGVTRKHIYTLLRAGHLIAIDISESGCGGAQSIRVLRESIAKFIQLRTINPDDYNR